MDYYPYGGERIDETTTDFSARHTFTDQERDSESGLLYYGARYYHPIAGRFTSIDPASLYSPQSLLADPQSLNAYSYARNNPIIYTDPSGRRIVINNATNSFETKTFNDLRSIYYNLDVAKTNGGFEIRVNNGPELNFIEKVSIKFAPEKNYSELENKPIGKNLLSILSASANTVNINYEPNTLSTSPTNRLNASNGVGTGASISYDPFYTEISTTNYIPSKQSTVDQLINVYIALAHELIHTLHYNQGTLNRDNIRDYGALDGTTIRPDGGVKFEELRTVGISSFSNSSDITENKIRSENNIYPRNQY